MPIEFHNSGVRFLLQKIDGVRKGVPLSDSDIQMILANADVDIWLCAYERWIEGARRALELILASLHKESPEGLDQWGQMIDFGLRVAVDEPDRMSSALKFFSEFSWSQAEQNTLRFLPEGTPMEVKVILTIDGFNSGMFQGNHVFLSFVYFDPSLVSENAFTHEFHHGGVTYWFNRHPLVQKYTGKKGTQEAWLVELFTYIVSEGLANAFCSPDAISLREGEGMFVEKLNSTIRDFEARQDEIFTHLEKIIRYITEEREHRRSVKEPYERLTLAQGAASMPAGHFLSGRMVQTMDKSSKVTRGQIVGLVKEPFDFFTLYNIAAKDSNHRQFTPKTLKSIDIMLEKMRKDSASP